MTQAATTFKNVANRLLDLHDGRILEPGGERKLTTAEQDLPHNRQLIETGQLIEADHKPAKTKEDDR